MTRSFGPLDEIWLYSPSSLSSDEVADAFNSIQKSLGKTYHYSSNRYYPSDMHQDGFQSFQKIFDSSFKWTVMASISKIQSPTAFPFIFTCVPTKNQPNLSFSKLHTVTSVLITVAVVAVVLALINCLKKAGNAIPQYTLLSRIDDDKLFNKVSSMESTDTNKVENAVVEPRYPIVSDSVLLKTDTMEIFLSEMVREKPTRFSPEQLDRFTSNFSTVLGLGGFGVVYKGELPKGLPVAVKVLNSNVDKKVFVNVYMDIYIYGEDILSLVFSLPISSCMISDPG